MRPKGAGILICLFSAVTMMLVAVLNECSAETVEAVASSHFDRSMDQIRSVEGLRRHPATSIDSILESFEQGLRLLTELHPSLEPELLDRYAGAAVYIINSMSGSLPETNGGFDPDRSHGMAEYIRERTNAEVSQSIRILSENGWGTREITKLDAVFQERCSARVVGMLNELAEFDEIRVYSLTRESDEVFSEEALGALERSMEFNPDFPISEVAQRLLSGMAILIAVESVVEANSVAFEQLVLSPLIFGLAFQVHLDHDPDASLELNIEHYFAITVEDGKRVLHIGLGLHSGFLMWDRDIIQSRIGDVYDVLGERLPRRVTNRPTDSASYITVSPKELHLLYQWRQLVAGDERQSSHHPAASD